MGTWKRSGVLSTKSWDLIKENRELLRFPVMGAVVGGITGAVFVVPGVVLLALSDGDVGLIVAGVVLLLVGAYVATFSVIRFGAGLVAAADELLHGRPSGYADGMARSSGHTKALSGWALVQVTVGALLSLLRGDGSDGLAVTIIRFVAAGIVGAAWALISFFALPIIVLEGTGPIEALKRSARVTKERWGETAVGGVRISVRAAIWWVLPGVVLLVGGVVLALAVDATPALVGGAILALVGLVMVLVGAVLASAARTVFAVALYRFATASEAIGPFTVEELHGAVRHKGEKPSRKAA